VWIAGKIGNRRDRTTLHFGKISEMKSRSKPPLPIEIFPLCQNLSPDEEVVRKNFILLERDGVSLSQGP
jgi:hypothetical protein